MLAGGPKPAVEIATQAWKLGISKTALKGAKKHLGVVSDKAGMAGGWEWSLPAAPEEL